MLRSRQYDGRIWNYRVGRRKHPRRACTVRRMPPLRRHPPGLILIPAAHLSRYTRFHKSLAAVDRPAGTEVRFVEGFSTVENLNWGLRKGYPEWVWLLGDDHEFRPDALTLLLDNDVDVVAPLVTMKAWPFTLLAWKEKQTPLLPTEIPQDRMIEVWACGSAGMLVRSQVLDALGDPWFMNGSGERSDEDIVFCLRAREAGFQIHVDPRVPLGHIGTFTAWPRPIDGDWEVHLDLRGGKVVVEAPRPHIMRRHRPEVSSPP